MADNEVLLGVRTTGTSEAASEIKSVADATREIGTASEDSAASQSLFSQAISEAVDAITTSNESVDAQITALEDLRDNIETVASEFSDATHNMNKADEAIGTVNDAIARLKDTSQDAAAATKEMGKAADSAGQAMVTGITSVDAPAKTLRDRLDEVNKKFAEGGRVTPQELAKVRAAHVALTKAVDETGKSAADLGPEFKKSLDIAEKEVEDVRRKFVQSEQELGRFRRTLNDTGATWRGFGKEAQDALGPSGAALGKMTLAFTVFKVAFTETQQVLRSMGVDLREQEELFEKLQERLLNVGAQMREAVSEAVQGNWKDMTEALHGADVALRANTDTLKTYNALVSGGILLAGEWRDNMELVEQVTASYNLTQQAGADGMKVWNHLARQHKGDMGGFAQALEDMAPALQAHIAQIEAVKESNRQLEAAFKAVTTAAEQRVKAEQKAEDDLAKLYQKRADATKALDDATAAQNAASTAVYGYTEAVSAQELAVSQAEDAHRKAKVEVEKLSGQYTAGDPILEEAIRKEKRLADNVNTTKTRLGEAQSSLASARSAQESAASAAEKHAEGLGKVHKEIGDSEEKRKAFNQQIQDSAHWAEKAAEAVGAPNEKSLVAVFKKLADSAPAVAEFENKVTAHLRATRTEAEALASALQQVTDKTNALNGIDLGPVPNVNPHAYPTPIGPTQPKPTSNFGGRI
jgi:DNA repair exonuclease SbcCD ATPase subunit